MFKKQQHRDGFCSKKNHAPLHFRCSYAAVAPFSCS